MNKNLKWATFIVILLAIASGSAYLFARSSPGGAPSSSATATTSASAAPTPAAPSGKTIITWTPTSVNEILSPGESKTVSVSFTSSKNIQRVSVQVSSQLQSLVQVQPQILDRVRKNQPRTVTLTFAPISTAALGTATGTIQLRKEKKDPNDKDEGDEQPGTLLQQALPVTVNTWAPTIVPQASLSFNTPPLSASSQIVTTTDTDGTIVVEFELEDPQSHEFLPVFNIVSYANPSHQSLQTWFQQNIDINNILLDQGTYAAQQMPNGLLALVFIGALPDAYGQAGGGPINDIYMISPAQDRVVTIISAQDNPIMGSLGYTPDAFRLLLSQILGTARVQ